MTVGVLIMGGDQVRKADVRPVLKEFKSVGVSITRDYNYITIMTLML